MLRNRRERGEGQFGCLVGLALLVIAGLVAYRMIPIKVKAAELRDTVIDEAKAAGNSDNRHIERVILDKAERLELPLKKSGVKINRKANEIRVDVKYTVPVQFPGFTYQWKFHHHAENPIF